MSKKIKKLPEANGKDNVRAVTKAVLSSIPYIGGTASELFSFIIPASLEKRRDVWLQEVADGLNELNEKMDGFSIDSLSENEHFINMLLNASNIALRNHQKEKLRALKIAVLNSAKGIDIEEDLQVAFLSMIDSLTPSHLIVTRYFLPMGRSVGFMIRKDESGTYNRTDEYNEYAMQMLDELPEFKENEAFLIQIIKDLEGKGLINKEEWDDGEAKDITLRRSKLGEDFMKLVMP